MKIAFVSTRGIPNNYGGFEQFAEYISVGLAARGHDVTVYCPHYHPYQKSDYKGVHLKHIYSPEKWLGGSIGSFFYDFLSLRDALKNERFDIIYEAGYTSIIPAYIWFNVKNIKYPVFTTNMDGLEFKRSKFNKWVQKFIHWEEKEAVKHSQYLIADNMGIHDYYKTVYGKECYFLAYGADIYHNYSTQHLDDLGLTPHEYYLIIARIEPENNIEMIIKGYKKSKEYDKKPLVIVGKTTTKLGQQLLKRYGKDPAIKFAGSIYNLDKINSIRHYSYAYFHGHSVGGTNPSLLEAMATSCFILAHQNIFNKAVLKENALYFHSSEDIADILNRIDTIIEQHKAIFINQNITIINQEYSWKHLIDQHEKYFKKLLSNHLK